MLGHGESYGRENARGERLSWSRLEHRLPSSPLASWTAELVVGRVQPFTRVPLSPDDAELVVYVHQDGARLAYRVTPSRRGPLPSAPRFIVDAHDGRILEARDGLRHAQAWIYPTNPVRSPELTRRTLAVAPDATTLQSDLLLAQSCVDHGARYVVDWLGAPVSVRGCRPAATALIDSQGDFAALPSADPSSADPDPFAEISAFHHAARALSFFEQLGGEAPELSDTPLPLVTNLRIARGLLDPDPDPEALAYAELVPFPAAFYWPGSADEGAAFRELYGGSRGALWLGQGQSVDFAYDGDLVYHELTHAVLDASLRPNGYRLEPQGLSSEPEALAEALADYFAAAMAGDPVIGEYAAREHPLGPRSLDNEARCPSALTGSPHDDGLMFSGALWRVRQGLAAEQRQRFDQAVYHAARLPVRASTVGFQEFAELLSHGLAADPSARASLASELERRGLARGCHAVLEISPGETLRAPRGPFVAPGTLAVGLRELAPGVLQFEVAVPTTGAQRLTVTFTATPAPAAPWFGRVGSTFAPVLLAEWDAPIVWTDDAVHASARRELNDDRLIRVELDVPEGARTAFLQIANRGELDGHYDRLRVAFAPRSVAPPDAPSSATLTQAEPELRAVPPRSRAGCTHSPSKTKASAGWLCGAALAALVSGLRRRRAAATGGTC